MSTLTLSPVKIPLHVLDIHERVKAVAIEIGRGAAGRDQSGELPFAEFKLVRESGIGALRIPRRLGGPGGTVADVIEAISTLASGDSNVAHALRSHFNFTETLALGADTPEQRLRARQILDGALFGGAGAELGTPKPSNTTTSTLVKTGDVYRLNGHKFYTTGTAFCDYVSTSALNAAGDTVRMILPTQRAGIEIINDWDGMGQRLTASGSVRFNDVEVTEDEFLPAAQSGRTGPVSRHVSTLRQLILMACQAGSVRRVLSDAVGYGKHQARPISHSHADTARGDFFVQREIGKIAALTHTIDVLIDHAARTLDESAEAILAGDPQVEALLAKNSIAVAKAQVVIAPLALDAAESIFNVGGASATSRQRGYDRHWRNIRTIMSHNPVFYKEKAIGDYLLNDTAPPTEGGFF